MPGGTPRPGDPPPGEAPVGGGAAIVTAAEASEVAREKTQGSLHA